MCSNKADQWFLIDKRGGRGELIIKRQKKTLVVIDMFITLIVVTVLWVYTDVKCINCIL